MSSTMSATSLEDGVMVKIGIEPVFSNKPAAAGESAEEEVKKVVEWIADVDCEIKKMKSREEKTRSLWQDVSAVDPNSKKEKEKEIMVMPSDLSLSSSSHVKNSCSMLRLQQQRKTRRSWSRDLHEQFLVALEQLGGPQTATPKRIIEAMEVDGLTYDEVKSHLQKYRVYSQKNAKGSRTVDQSLSLYGGSPQEHYATWNQTVSMSPEGPFEFEKVDDELCFKEEVGDSGKDVGK